MNYKGFNGVMGMALLATTLQPAMAHADFVSDSKFNVELRNYYFNRDFRTGTGQNNQSELAQGFLLNFQSGYTQGPVGFGIDLTGLVAVKLDSSPGRAGTGNLAPDNEPVKGGPSYAKRAQDQSGRLGVTAKMRFEQSEVKAGFQIPKLPILWTNTSRLLPQSFNGVTVVSKDFNNFNLIGGQITRVNQRDSTDYDKLGVFAQSGAYKAGARSDSFKYLGGDYTVAKGTVLTYQHAVLENIYKQDFAGASTKQKFGPGVASLEARYSNSDEDGSGLAGLVDNHTFGYSLGYSLGGHTLSVGSSRVYGSSPFIYVNGTNSYLFTEAVIGNFSKTGERSWFATYDVDFAPVGIPGLTSSLNYISGDDATVVGSADKGREWERDFGVRYVVQTGSLKGASVRWVNAYGASNFGRHINDNRLFLSYTYAIW
ncbi:OprD family porin [Pseudomonas syringae pv. actinidiae]|nr:OprD family porin [Pseudomonas syringae pv. actinidiae]NVL34663.1 OprD family porin [Pseudomonas syringae pv. actinidiae]